MLDEGISGLADITPEWLADALRQEGHLKAGDTIEAVTVGPMGEGVGMMSTLARLRIESEADMPTSLIVKIPAENEQNRSVAQQYFIYMKETRFYHDLAPATDSRSPKIYASYLDDDQNFLLLMEDLSGYRLGDQVTGATVTEARLCIGELAKLHASFWGGLDHIDWLPHISNSHNATTIQLGAESGWPQLMEYFGEKVPESVSVRKDEYLAKIGALQERLDGEPETLIHGDFRMDNMLFGQTPHHHPLVIVDYQGPLKGRGMADIGYFMGHSVDPKVRRENERALLKDYVDGLKERGVTGYEFDRAWEDYRLATLYAWAIAVVIAGTLDPSNERGFAWMRKMVERNGVALEELGCLDLLAGIPQ